MEKKVRNQPEFAVNGLFFDNGNIPKTRKASSWGNAKPQSP